MAAAYAALVSLLNTMDQIHIHPLVSTFFDHYPIESLREKVDFFLDFVENRSEADSTEADNLVGRIALVSHVAEDIIERQVADRIRAGSTEKSPNFLPDLLKIIQDMDSIKEEVIKAKEETGFITRQPTYYMPPPPSSSSAPLATAKTTTMVGFDAYLMQLLDELTGHHSGRLILPIVGMGGIGKTTLAGNVYEDSHTVHHFDVRAWVTVSQEFTVSEILLQALSCLGGSTSTMDRTDDKLGEELHKSLTGRRYLIVLDDVWSVEAWEKIKFFFPENNNRSRIVVTTRQSEVADYFGSSAFVVDFLDDKKSWELFSEVAFAQEGCPTELEEVGMKIVRKCKGLPLAIAVIGGLLGKSSRTREYWLKIEKDISLVLNSTEGNQLFYILSLSYKYLPVCLKSCFLYLGLFPEDHEIDVSQLIKLWIAEGFIKSNTIQSLEEIAESFIKDLVDRKLLLVRHLKQNRKFKSCGVHDVVRDLCIRIAETENFFCVQRDIDGARHFRVDERMSSFYPPTPSIIRGSRLSRVLHRLDCKFQQVYLRFLFHESPHVEFHTSQTTSLDRMEKFHRQRRASFKSRLLRALGNDMDTLGEVNLRFLYHQYQYHNTLYELPYQLPSSISQLWSLQSLIIKRIQTVVAPSAIWKMPQLRHIEMWSICLPHPPPRGEHDDDVFVLQNLHTFKEVHNLILSEEVCKRIPNIKELHIHYDCGEASSCCNLVKVGCLNKLESLRYSCRRWECAGDSLQNLKLPSSLKELTLSGCHLIWDDMAMIGLLPHLEILELLDNAVVGPKWDSVEEPFLSLKHLQIDECVDLIYWSAESYNFPVLETLSLRSLPRLDEIPSGIGEIPTLEEIYMFDCSESSTISAVEILEEQESLGNQGLQLQLKLWEKTTAVTWREKMEELGFSCQNLLINAAMNMMSYIAHKDWSQIAYEDPG